MALLTLDNAKISEVASQWGIGNADMFASATLLRPYTGGDQSFSSAITGVGASGGGSDPGGAYEANQRITQGLRQFLDETHKFPKELVFLGRSMRIIQGNNQLMGSPVNRVKLTALAASRGLLLAEVVENRHKLPRSSSSSSSILRIDGWRETFRAYWKYAIFRLVVLGSDLIFLAIRVRQILSLGNGDSFEDEIEKRMKSMAKEDFGIDLNNSVFDG